MHWLLRVSSPRKKGDMLSQLVALVDCAGHMGNRLDQAEAAIGAVNQRVMGELRTLQDRVAYLQGALENDTEARTGRWEYWRASRSSR